MRGRNKAIQVTKPIWQEAKKHKETAGSSIKQAIQQSGKYCIIHNT